MQVALSPVFHQFNENFQYFICWLDFARISIWVLISYSDKLVLAQILAKMKSSHVLLLFYNILSDAFYSFALQQFIVDFVLSFVV